MSNPTLINGFEDVLTFISQQAERVKKLEAENKKLKEALELANQRKMPYGWTTESCKNWMEENKELKATCLRWQERADFNLSDSEEQ